MNLANMAPGRAPWTGAEPLVAPPLAAAAVSLQLSFELPLVPEPPSATPPAWPSMSEPRDSSRHGAELAALLVILQPAETGFLPIADMVLPLLAEDAPPLPPAPLPLPLPEGADFPFDPALWTPPLPASLPPAEWLMP